MDSLRPERDEVARFQASRQSKQSEAQSKSKGKPKQQVQKNKAGSGSPVLGFGLLVVFAVIAAGGWFGYQQHLVIQKLEQDLSETSSFVNQSKLLMARFEGELSETGEELEQSGASASTKLKFLDSEMRKLWAVSNERNKGWIKENQQAIDKLSGGLSKQQAAVKKNAVANSMTEKELQLVKGDIDTVSKSVSSISGEVSIARSQFTEELLLVRDDLSVLEGTKGLVEENKKAVESIDASRRQLIERVVALEKKVNALQLKLKAANASAPAGT